MMSATLSSGYLERGNVVDFRISKLIAAAVLISSTATVSRGTIAKEAPMDEPTKLRSAYPFGETVQKLRSILQSNGFTVFAVIDQREAAKSAGLDMPPTTQIIYGNPKGGTPMMLAAPDFAIELPLRVLVREDAPGKALVLFNAAISLEGRHGLPAGMASRLAGGEAIIAAAVSAAIQN
jgi:uncharacterized protein (DUF302 family)